MKSGTMVKNDFHVVRGEKNRHTQKKTTKKIENERKLNLHRTSVRE